MTDITEINKYKLLNTYRALAQNGLLEPLNCPDCKSEYSVWVHDGDTELENPSLHCFVCNSDLYLSKFQYANVRRAIEEVGYTF